MEFSDRQHASAHSPARRSSPRSCIQTRPLAEIFPPDASGIDDATSESTQRMRVHIVASALFLSWAMSIHANEPLTMAVSPVQSFAPTNLTIRVHVEPDAGNRAFEVVAESSDYYRSSRIQLDGVGAPRTIALEIRNLPGGDYDVRGALIDSAGHERAAVRRQSRRTELRRIERWCTESKCCSH